ncbi:11195_t:CDS:2, partial [Gigaspora rosea]
PVLDEIIGVVLLVDSLSLLFGVNDSVIGEKFTVKIINKVRMVEAQVQIVGFTQSLRDLNNTDKIRVNAIAPGFVDTNLVKESRKSSSEIVQLIDKFGYVPMDEVINAFMMAIQDDNLVGDIIMLPKKNTSQIISNSYLESMGLAN